MNTEYIINYRDSHNKLAMTTAFGYNIIDAIQSSGINTTTIISIFKI